MIKRLNREQVERESSKGEDGSRQELRRGHWRKVQGGGNLKTTKIACEIRGGKQSANHEEGKRRHFRIREGGDQAGNRMKGRKKFPTKQIMRKLKKTREKVGFGLGKRMAGNERQLCGVIKGINERWLVTSNSG